MLQHSVGDSVISINGIELKHDDELKHEEEPMDEEEPMHEHAALESFAIISTKHLFLLAFCLSV